MEFETGDKVHVKRLGGKEVDFYATIGDFAPYGEMIELINCTNKSSESVGAYLPNNEDFGPDKTDYYTLTTDEEDSEEPEIQYTEEMWRQAGKNIRSFMNGLNDKLDNDTHDPVNKPSHYMLGDIEVKDIIAIVADKYHKGSVAHNVASALEYQMRAPEKNGLEDIKKARKCLDFAIENWE